MYNTYILNIPNWTTKQVTVNGADVNTSVTFTKNATEKVTISVSAEKIGSGPEMVMRATGGGVKNIGSTCSLSTTAQSYIDEYGNTINPTFLGWWKDGAYVSKSEYYTFTVVGNASYIAKWSWN